MQERTLSQQIFEYKNSQSNSPVYQENSQHTIANQILDTSHSRTHTGGISEAKVGRAHETLTPVRRVEQSEPRVVPIQKLNPEKIKMSQKANTSVEKEGEIKILKEVRQLQAVDEPSTLRDLSYTNY